MQNISSVIPARKVEEEEGVERGEGGGGKEEEEEEEKKRIWPYILHHAQNFAMSFFNECFIPHEH